MLMSLGRRPRIVPEEGLPDDEFARSVARPPSRVGPLTRVRTRCVESVYIGRLRVRGTRVIEGGRSIPPPDARAIRFSNRTTFARG
jgi:hypothetical protein